MRILIDTNIFIHLEDNKIMNDSYAKFIRLCSTYNHHILIHPYSIQDLQRDKNESRKKISLSKINKYQYLESPPIPNELELKELGLTSVKDNDIIDNIILFALIKESVGILITEDIGIHKKAKKIGLDTRVLFLKQALHSLELLHKVEDYHYPNILDKKVYNLDIEDTFFNSLKIDYPEFSDWFKKISQEARNCWVYHGQDDKLSGLIIYKDEMNPIVTISGDVLSGKTLKISTFKVAEEEQGKKIGELFLKKIFSFSMKNGYQNIYLTTRANKQIYLVNLIEDFGFKPFKLCSRGRDMVYIKKIPDSAPEKNYIDKFEYHKNFFPYIDCRNVKKHFIPIKPLYHRTLFPEIEKQQQFFYNNVQAGNTIKKIYLSHTKNTKLSKGDIILFYRSEDKQAITTLGIIEHIETAKANDFNKILEYSLKRSVYNYEQIKEMSKKETLILLFRIVYHFDNPIKRDWLISNIGYKNCQTICELKDESFQRILVKADSKYCYYTKEL